MRLAQVGLGSGVGLPGKYLWDRFLVRSASYMFPYQKRQTTTATTTPGEIEVQKRNRFYKKTPLLQPTVGEWVSEISCKHRLPQARCLFGPLFIRLPVPAEGRL